MYLPEFDELYVISDLHMGGKPGFQIFKEGTSLGKFIESLGDRPGRVCLVVNGDIVDFLAEAPAMYLDAPGAIKKLERIWGDAAFKPVFEALKAFVQVKNRRLVFVLGNHDVELALPETQEWFFDQLAGESVEARGQIVSAMSGSGFSCTVGGKRILCTHGNEVDGWNVIDFRALLNVARAMARAEDLPDWDACAGTRMVIDVMNPIKKRFPFVDLLKPENEAVVPTIAALDPSSLRKLGKAARLFGRKVKDQALIERGFLTVEQEAIEADELPSEEEFLRGFVDENFRRAGQARDSDVGDLLLSVQEDIEAGVGLVGDDEDDEFLGIGDWFKEKIAEIRENAPEYLRSALKKFLEGDDTFDLHKEDTQFKKLDALIGRDVDYVITGHTHLARALDRRHPGTYYLNTGTWIRLMQLEEATLEDRDAFAKIFAAIQSGTIAALDDQVDQATGKKLVKRWPHVAKVATDENGTYGALYQPDEDGAIGEAREGSRLPA